MLRLDAIEVAYGELQAVQGVSLEVREGEIVSVIGSNGAGKTTTLRAVSGLLPLRGGRITLDGGRIDGQPPRVIVERGIGHVPEGRQLFPSLTVLENLEMGARTPRAKAAKADTLRQVFELFPRLEERKHQAAGTLSGGEQQMVAIARGLMAKPKLLMLDEPSLGLAPIIVQQMFDVIDRICKSGTTVLLVEQKAFHALKIADRAYVIENGQIALENTGIGLLSDPHIKTAYLGI